GIGAAAAAALSAAGARVVAVSRGGAGGADGIHPVRCDVTDAEAVSRLARTVAADYGTPDIVVSNAGGFLLRRLEETSVEEFDGQVAVNLRGAFLVARAFLPAMRAAGRGSYLSVGSVADHVGFPENAAYAAAKYGLRGLHETLVAEYRGSGVRLTLVSPGPTDTAMWDPIDPDGRPGFPSRAAMLRPEDVAEAIVFAASRPAGVHIEWIRLGPA
ncbi:MAG TPA: SDR family oxidoreductase, partial [Gemmatimonadales bacterium]|nr:SDR family oxidoreductase [Gemmatimonadales bacterium]